jgi:recombination protein RecR
MTSPIIENLIQELCRLPGFGIRSATRIVYFLLTRPREDIDALIGSLKSFAEGVKVCTVCNNVSEQDPCPVCTDNNRDKSQICVVEEPLDLAAIESAGVYRGQYHILGGALNALEGIGPDKLHITGLLARLDNETVKEVIFALNPTPEGDTTAAYIIKKIQADNKQVCITQLAQGISAGSILEFADKRTIKNALQNRKKVE